MTLEQIKALSDSELTRRYIAAEKAQPRYIRDQSVPFHGDRSAWMLLPAVTLTRDLSREMDYRFSDFDTEAQRAERLFGC